MATKEQIHDLINSHLNHVLLCAQAALPPQQFQAYRKLVLDEFGKGGLGKELDRLFEGQQYVDR